MLRAYALFITFCVVFQSHFLETNSTCPRSKGLLHRIGNTRFYIIQDPKNRDNYVNQTEAYDECEQYDLKLAKIKDMQTLAVVGRPLEKFARKHQMKDTFYWLDAKYNKREQKYFWGRNGEDGEVKFSNYYYRRPRPTGINSHVDFKHEHLLFTGKEQCLQLSLPFFGPWDENSDGEVFGHQTMLDERHCESRKTRHVICEAGPECASSIKDSYVLTEDNKEYFEEGDWIFGDRAYMVNWKYRSLDKSIQYCEQRGLKLFMPESTKVSALIPYLKMWSREVTTSQFWTDLKFLTNGSFTNPDGGIIFNLQGDRKYFTEGSRAGRMLGSLELEDKFCVSLIHTYEFKTQMPCPKEHQNMESKKCSWSYLEYAPTNCNNYFATICMPKDKKSHKLLWKSKYVKNVDLALTETATLPFGHSLNKNYERSRYKQTFGGLVCPPSFRMVRDKNNEWYKEPQSAKLLEFKYDYSETYWVVDKGAFNKNKDSDCTVSVPSGDGFKRSLEVVKCSTWHFYLCESVDEKDIIEWNGTLNRAEPMEWREGVQKRAYPIVKA